MESIDTLRSVYEQMEDRRTKLFELLDQYRAVDLKKKESADKWSVNQVLTHLVEAEIGIVRYIKKKIQSPELLAHNDYKTRIRSALLKLVLAMPFKFKMPRQLSPPSNKNEYDELKKRYDIVRKEIIELMSGMSGELHEKKIFKHPLAGRITPSQTLNFMGDHMVHHERQILRILKKFDPI